MIGILNEAQIEQLLRAERLARIGVFYRDRVYVVPVNFLYDGVSVFGYTSQGTKVHMMRHSSHVCFEVDHVDRDGWKSVIAWGDYVELQGAEARDALSQLVQRLSPTHTVEGLTGNAHVSDFQPVVYRIQLTEKHGRYERKSAA